MNISEINEMYKWSKVNYGYVVFSKDNCTIYRHKLIWTLNFGDIPDGYSVDHINRKKQDDRLCNLRLVTPLQNHLNEIRPQKAKISKYKGVGIISASKRKNRKKHWFTLIDFKTINLKYNKMHSTELEAAKDYDRFMLEEAPKELVLEHKLEGNVEGRFIPLLNKDLFGY